MDWGRRAASPPWGARSRCHWRHDLPVQGEVPLQQRHAEGSPAAQLRGERAATDDSARWTERWRVKEECELCGGGVRDEWRRDGEDGTVRVVVK